MRNFLLLVIFKLIILKTIKKYSNLNYACQKHSLFCPMNEAIEKVFYIYQYEENNLNIKEKETETEIQVISSNIHFLEPKCFSVYYYVNDTHYYIKKFNCSVLVISKLDIGKKYNNIVYFNNFLMELLIKEMIFATKIGEHEININFTFQNETINYNKNEPLFNIPLIKNQIEKEFERIGNDLKKLYMDDLTNKFLLSDADTNLERVFNFLYRNGPFFFYQEYNITYLSYDSFVYNYYIIDSDTIFISNLSVVFEYAIDYNIDYNEGLFIISDFIYTKNKDFSNSTRSFEFIANTELDICKQNFILNKFYENFRIAVKNYTNIVTHTNNKAVKQVFN